MFDLLDAPPEDPLLGLIAAFRNDPSPAKVDLGVGVYKNERGVTAVMDVVKAAERRLVNEQDSKSYLGSTGNERFNHSIAALVLGENHAALRDDRVRSIQAPGGCGALRIAAELIHRVDPATAIVVSDPTWPNHLPLLGGAGLAIQSYPYYDAATGKVRFEQMLERLQTLPRGSVVVIHGACHNPTGADLSREQWQTLTQFMSQHDLVPFIDLAYQGLGDSLDEDAAGVRLMAETLPEALIAVSCSKNFGLYRERTGALLVVGKARRQADAAAASLAKVARGCYAMPPDHGAAIVAMILTDAKLVREWRRELTAIRNRISSLRSALAEALGLACEGGDFSALARQRGMFSMLNLTPLSIERLRREKHIYIAGDGRVNISGLNEKSVDHVAWSVAEELNKAASRYL